MKRGKKAYILTTIRLSGIPNKFMITDRYLSGIYLARSEPIEGKYIPTQTSKNKNEP